jgi:uncharacterized protein (DUF58 family)
MRRPTAVFLGGVGLILAALTFEVSTLFVPGAALVLISVAVPAWVWTASRGARLSRTLNSDRVLEDQPLEARIEVRHGALGLPGCHVLDPLAGKPIALNLPLGITRRRTEVRVVARFARRGRRRLRAPEVALQDPFAIVRFVRAGTDAGQEVLVLPRTERPQSVRGDLTQRLEVGGGGPVPEPLAAIEVDGLRAYRQGTPASRIHWPALARGAGLLERRLRPEAGSGPLVVLDGRCQAEREPLDRAVRAAASLVLELARHGGCELLLPGERRPATIEPDLGAWPAAHIRLALVEGGPDAPAPAMGPRPGKVFYVAAQLPGQGGLRGIERLPAAVLVLPRELALELGYAATFEVSGCIGLSVGAGRRAYARARAA